MNCQYGTAWLLPVLAVGAVLLGREPVTAQDFAADSRFELDQAVQLDRVDGKVLAQLERVKAYLAGGQFSEAIDTLREVMENSEDKLLPAGGQRSDRFVTLRDYGHLRLAALPAEALKLYRSRVDALAARWYEQGIARRDRSLLLRVVEQAPVSSWGDDALLALGEMALESGDYASARWHWERIIPHDDAPPSWPGFPDSDLDPAAVRARLVLVSILEGSPARAREELARYGELHGDARGRFGGRKNVNFVEALRTLLADSGAWPARKASADWPTFAGSPSRNKAAPEMVDVAAVAWRTALPAMRTPDMAALLLLADDTPAPQPRLSYHPVLVGDRVLVNTLREILAIDVHTGKPAWGEGGAAVFRTELQGAAGEPSRRSLTVGVPRCTMTVFDGRLYARMGTPITGRPRQAGEDIRPGYLVCLDLEAEGRLMWKIAAEAGWAFEGSPVADAANVYVAMRSSRPQAHVACFDAQTGRRRWLRFVCGAETLARGSFFEATHNLLTLHRETIYYNTNLGAVAALSSREGRLKWVTLYPRARRADPSKLPPHWRRDLNPCLYNHGTLIVAPADSPQIFGLDAANGQILWQSSRQVEGVVHLLGTTEDHLIASGDKLYWIGLQGEEAGRVRDAWPEGPARLECGRGLLAADNVLWPTKEKIYVFDQRTARPKRAIDLAARGITGGNLVVGKGYLLIATGTELIALGPQGAAPEKNANELTLIPTLRVHPN